jgi:predicted RNA-binding Zn-ribbon protein involved in translation (DUF1610 family)
MRQGTTPGDGSSCDESACETDPAQFESCPHCNEEILIDWNGEGNHACPHCGETLVKEMLKE